MKRIATSSLLVLAAFSLLVSTAYAQEPDPVFNPQAIVDGLNSAFWITLFITMIAGAVGGLVYELLILQGNVELPHKPVEKEFAETLPYAVVENVRDLGIVARVIIGALAAVAALLVISPSTTFGLLATAVVAGSAGTAIFRSMQDRLTAALAQKEASEAIRIAAVESEMVKDAAAALAAVKNNMLIASLGAAAPGNVMVASATQPSGAMADLDEVERLMNQAVGVSKALNK